MSVLAEAAPSIQSFAPLPARRRRRGAPTLQRLIHVRGSAVILAAIAVHAAWAALIFGHADSLAPTPLGWADAEWWPFLPLIYVLAAASAMAGLLASDDRLRFTLLVPQQFVLLLSAGAAVGAMVLGHYADGVARERAFIVIDQLPIVALALGHTVALLLSGRR